GRVGDRPWHRVVLLAGDDQQWAAVRVLVVDLGLRPWVEVGRRRLEQRRAGGRDHELLVELLGLLLADRVGEAVAELVERQRDGGRGRTGGGGPRRPGGARGRGPAGGGGARRRGGGGGGAGGAAARRGGGAGGRGCRPGRPGPRRGGSRAQTPRRISGQRWLN